MLGGSLLLGIKILKPKPEKRIYQAQGFIFADGQIVNSYEEAYKIIKENDKNGR